jgi:hypothetical protein
MLWTRLVQIAFIAAVLWAVYLSIGLVREFLPELRREWDYWKEEQDDIRDRTVSRGESMEDNQ